MTSTYERGTDTPNRTQRAPGHIGQVTPSRERNPHRGFQRPCDLSHTTHGNHILSHNYRCGRIHHALTAAAVSSLIHSRTTRRKEQGYDHLVGGGGTFSSDLGTAQNYDGIASIFGFNFGGHTGFTTNITHDYSNGGSATTYLCGTGYMPDVPILYNTT